MVPLLRLELNDETALQLHNIPQDIKDDIEQYHHHLLSQVVKLYYQKCNELETYAKQKIHECNWNVSGPDTKEESDRKLKSIVKRRPSKTDKRVSFSNSPPHVEHFKKYDDDEGALEAFSEQEEFTHVPSPPPAAETSQASPPTKSMPFQIAMPHLMSDKSSRSNEPTRDEALDVQDDLFAFEDVIESSPSISGSTVLVHSSRDSSSSSLNESDSGNDSRSSSVSSIGETGEPTDPALIQQFSVGSAPLDIRPNPNKIEYDGGPPQKTESLHQEEILEDAALCSPSSSLANQNTIDPSKMSFSQRIEWEKTRNGDEQ